MIRVFQRLEYTPERDIVSDEGIIIEVVEW
jgi:hypothetical protein